MNTQSVKESRGSYFADVAKELVAAASESSFDATTFFDKFELLAETSGAIAKLRQIVLHLAFKGGLTKRNGENRDEQLLAKIDADVDQLAGKKRSQSKRQMVESSEQPFVIPESWQWTTLGRIGNWGSGSTPKRGTSEYYNGTFSWLKSGELNDARNLVGSEEKVSEIAIKQCSFRLNQKGDILFAMYGATVGKVAILGEEAVTNQAVCGCTPSRYVDNVFLYFYLISQRQTFRDTSEGGAQPNFSKDKIVNFPFPLPPLTEQELIVARVDELMGLCDRLEALEAERKDRHASLSRAALARFAAAPTPTNLQFLFHKSYDIAPAELRKSILTLAIQGKLVAQDANDEPAVLLIDQIAAHKTALASDGKLRGLTTVKPLASDQAEFELPPNWCWVRFGEIMVNRDGERIPVSKEIRETKAKKYDYYGASGVIDKIDEYLFDKPLLLIGEDGANLINRSTPIAFIARGKYWVNNHAHVLDGISTDFLQFIELYINAINLEKYVTGSAQPKMNQAKMNSIPIALPPLAEQKRIVAKVDELMALVDQLVQQLAHSRTLGQQLLEAVVGELTKG